MERLHWFYGWMGRLPIRWRLALVSFGLLAGLLAALGILISVTEESALLASQANTLSSQASLVAAFDRLDKLDTSPLPENKISPDAASNVIATARKIIGLNKNIGVSVVAPDGGVIAADYEDTGSPVVTLQQVSIQQWLSTHTLYILANDSQGQRELVILQPIQEAIKQGKAAQPGTVTIALLQLSTPTTPVDQAVEQMRLILVIGIVGALVVAATLTLPLIRGALRPLVEMERVSTRIADGALSSRLKVPKTRDEVGRLASSFNSMVTRLEAAFARQKQFVADVSHELRTPLTALGGSMEMLLLEADNGDPDASRRLVRGMYAEVERMQRLVADLLVLSRLDEGQIKLHEERVDMGILAGEVYEQARQLARGQEIRCTAASSCLTVCGDADQLRRVLLNIVENALKFTPETGQIEVSVCNEGTDEIVVEVCDTGTGIPEEALPHVFDRFYRVDASRTRSSSQAGSGLGLSIAQGLVNAHGGTISISSAPGDGTAVTLRLPAVQ